MAGLVEAEGRAECLDDGIGRASPNDDALVDPERRRIVAERFDRQFYLDANPDVATAGIEPIDHYLQYGWREGRRPAPDFDPAFYLAANPDVATAGVEPFYHFVTRGRVEGRQGQAPIEPAPSGELSYDPSQYQVIAEHFDKQFYLENYPGVAEAGLDPLAHYLRHGWREGCFPNSDFDTAYYLARNPDVVAAGVNPFYHYITSGAAEARPGSAHEAIRRAIAPHFDREFYLQRNPDIAATSQDALDHYIKAGWREGRWPTPDFDTDYYVRANPDVIAAGMNPFQHYVVAGKREGRRAKAPFSAIRAVVAETHDLQFARLSPSRGNSEPPTLLTSDEFKRVLGLVEGRRAVVSLSHDEYTKNVGGVQIRVSDEQSAINQAGAAYIHFAPARPVLHVRDDKDFDALALALTIDGTSVGAVRAVDVLDELSQIVSDRAPTMTLVVHSLLGHSIPFIQALAERIRPAESIVWLHDFSTLCTNYSLLRNNLAFCGLPPVDSPMCQVCAFGDTRRADVALIEALFEALNPVVMAPSQAAMDFWRRNARYRHRRTVVAPHAAPMLTGTLPPAAAQRALRVAHVGAPAIHKGWLEYQELAADFSGDPRYSFYLLSVAPPAYLKNVQHVPVSVTRGDRGAMIEALKTHEIDVVVHWTLCYETYSFTAWESILAGSFVVAQKQSGNAAVLIRENNAGLLLDDCAELNQLFASDRLVEAVRRHRAAGAPVGHLAPADMADQILGGAAQ